MLGTYTQRCDDQRKFHSPFCSTRWVSKQWSILSVVHPTVYHGIPCRIKPTMSDKSVETLHSKMQFPASWKLSSPFPPNNVDFLFLRLHRPQQLHNIGLLLIVNRIRKFFGMPRHFWGVNVVSICKLAKAKPWHMGLQKLPGNTVSIALLLLALKLFWLTLVWSSDWDKRGISFRCLFMGAQEQQKSLNYTS